MRDYSPKRRTAVVFAGSGTAGAYHAGALKAIDESGVKVDIAIGTGVGAFTAACAAVSSGPRLYTAEGFWSRVTRAGLIRPRTLLVAVAVMRRRPNTEAHRIRPSRCREICSGRSERIRAASIFRTPGRAKRWSAPSMKPRRQSWKPRQSSPPRCCQPPLRGRSSIPRTTPMLLATPRMPARFASRTPWLPPFHRRRSGRG